MSKSIDILSHLNPSQQEAVTFKEGPLLILAGAGSGKTRVLTYRAAWLIKEKNIHPENILLLTFTNKAADEMKNRLRKLLASHSHSPTHNSPPTLTPWAGTFHSLCAKILRVDGKYLGIPPNYLIYNEDDSLETVKEAMKKLDISPKNFNPSSVLTTISQAKNELISSMEYPQYARGYFQETVARIYLTYQRLLKEAQALDFDDLLMETVKLFQKSEEVLSKYQNRYRWILIDEYQDTNHAQYILTKLLAKKRGNLTAVGDASQAIYGWRGADFRNLTSLQGDFPDLKIINLEQNYRSTQVILDAANQVINKNTSHPILNLWTTKKGGEKISLYQARSEEDEAIFVINKIFKHFFNYSSFAVLYRTNAQSRVLEEAFLHAGIPYILVGGVRFYERKEIKDCLAFLRVIANPKDEICLKRIKKLGKSRYQKFQHFLNNSNNLRNLPTVDILDQALKAVGYLNLFDPKDSQDLSRLENIQELYTVAGEFPNITQFLENVALIQQEYLPTGAPQTKAGRSNNAITMMTAHAAKGTEFPIVFIVGMEEGLFPHSRSMMEKDAIEEERRLCYVAMTRAKEKLYISYTHRRISRFIADIPPHLLE